MTSPYLERPLCSLAEVTTTRIDSLLAEVLAQRKKAMNDPDDWLMAGDWFLDGAGLLYIVPLPEVVAECHGPDNKTMDDINAMCRDHDRLTDDDAEQLGLRRVAGVLKRYHRMDGYYTA